MRMESRLLPLMFHIDTQLINSKQKIESVNRLEKWFDDGVILINMSATAHQEARAGSNRRRTKKANQQIFTDTAPASEYSRDFARVAAAIFPIGVTTENERNDVRIVCEAAKYGAILVTADGASRTQPGGILGNRHKLNGFVRIMTPEEAVNHVETKIRERDEFNREMTKWIKAELPPWTGKD
jgi:hypothetical protein